MDLRGSHWGNFKWLDPFGRFPGKDPVRQDISDRDLFELMLQKARLFKPQSIEHIIYNYADDQNQQTWLEVQRDIVLAVHREFPWASKFFRLDHRHYVDDDPKLGKAKAPLMVRDYAPIVSELTQLIQDDNGKPSIWFRFNNEPNNIGEGFIRNINDLQDPDSFRERVDYHNEWLKTIVWQIWNNYLPSYMNKPRNCVHGVFYPGLAPNLKDLEWYQRPSTQEVMGWWTTGVELHVYWETGYSKDPAWGERYELLWNQAIAPLNPYLPVIIGEWGNSSDDDMDTVKVPEYKEWLQNIGGQGTIPNIIATHCYILDGTLDWQKFILTLNACREIGALNL